MRQLVKVPATKPNLSSFPGTHTAGENHHSQAVLWAHLHRCLESVTFTATMCIRDHLLGHALWFFGKLTIETEFKTCSELEAGFMVYSFLSKSLYNPPLINIFCDMEGKSLTPATVRGTEITSLNWRSAGSGQMPGTMAAKGNPVWKLTKGGRRHGRVPTTSCSSWGLRLVKCLSFKQEDRVWSLPHTHEKAR